MTAPSGLTLSSLEVSTRRLLNEEDSTNTNYTSSEITDYLNEGIRRLATKLEWQTAVFTTYSVQDALTYTIPGHVISIISCHFDSKPVTIITRSDLDQISSSWLSDEAGVPSVAWRADRDKLGIFPKPDADNASKEIRIECVKLPDSLSASTDIPDIHISFHDTIPFYAAFRCQMKAGNRENAADCLKLFQNGIDEIKAQLEKFSDSSMSFVWGA